MQFLELELTQATAGLVDALGCIEIVLTTLHAFGTVAIQTLILLMLMVIVVFVVSSLDPLQALASLASWTPWQGLVPLIRLAPLQALALWSVLTHGNSQTH